MVDLRAEIEGFSQDLCLMSAGGPLFQEYGNLSIGNWRLLDRSTCEICRRRYGV